MGDAHGPRRREPPRRRVRRAGVRPARPPLGTAFISNVGTLDLDEAFLAPAPFARTAVYLAVGTVRERPVVVDGEVVVRPVAVLVATADHRILDGAHAGRLQRVVLELLADPARLDVPGAGPPG
ncbi:2-oxo acid dehydrogenase subunit E2 [Phycicoccus sp. HDW14]|uniref:2-oxo acid dehydrogenase subunit E2 n=1 Tax=Phycicoccus sp. HDW14 TaxID=2714941 RepID=UPI00140909F0|nr:2-oxo acid dehydrogenase subunit E2 [Phycicoccus sp. HDW14]